MNGLQAWNAAHAAADRQVRAGRRGRNVPVLLNAWQVAEFLHVDVEWVAARRNVLPCFDVPADDGEPSLARMRVRLEDLGEWKRATRETR